MPQQCTLPASLSHIEKARDSRLDVLIESDSVLSHDKIARQMVSSRSVCLQLQLTDCLKDECSCGHLEGFFPIWKTDGWAVGKERGKLSDSNCLFNAAKFVDERGTLVVTG